MPTGTILLAALYRDHFLRSMDTPLKGLYVPVGEEPSLIDQEYLDDTLLYIAGCH